MERHIADEPVQSTPRPAPSSSRQVARPLGETAATQGYWEYLPPEYGTGRHPLLVFLHGVGENGNGTSQLHRVLRNGPPRLIDEDHWPDERPFIVLSPQHAGDDCPSAGELHAFLEHAMSAYDVDPARVYLTGLSCGGIGIWRYLAEHLGARVAAAVTIAADGRQAVDRAGCALGRLPIWAFHGDADTIVPSAGTTVAMERLMACDPPPSDLRMTIYRGVGHDSWTHTYDLSTGHDIYTWLLRFKRS